MVQRKGKKAGHYTNKTIKHGIKYSGEGSSIKGKDAKSELIQGITAPGSSSGESQDHYTLKVPKNWEKIDKSERKRVINHKPEDLGVEELKVHFETGLYKGSYEANFLKQLSGHKQKYPCYLPTEYKNIISEVEKNGKDFSYRFQERELKKEEEEKVKKTKDKEFEMVRVSKYMNKSEVPYEIDIEEEY